MTTTISVDESTLERFRALKREIDEAQSDAPDHTSDSFLWALMDTWDAADGAQSYDEIDTGSIVEQLADEFEAKYDDGGDLHADEFAREVARRIDYAEIASKVAQDVAEELRR